MIFAKLLILAATQITVANCNEVDNNNCCFAMFGYFFLGEKEASSLNPLEKKARKPPPPKKKTVKFALEK